MQCAAMTRDGRPCSAPARTGGQFCFMHDPSLGAARAEARKRGGRRQRVEHAGDPGKLPARVRSLEDVLAVLDYALLEALPLENSIQRGRLIVAIAGAFIEAIKIGELESRLSAIENALRAREV